MAPLEQGKKYRPMWTEEVVSSGEQLEGDVQFFAKE
jgi:hypothetical protein